MEQDRVERNLFFVANLRRAHADVHGHIAGAPAGDGKQAVPAAVCTTTSEAFSCTGFLERAISVVRSTRIRPINRANPLSGTSEGATAGS